MSTARMPTVFDHMDFGSYEFREFPKAVRVGDKDVIVRDAEEEDAVRGGETLVREEDDRARLVKLAGVHGVQIDKRWGLQRIRETLATNHVNPDEDPDA